MNRSFSFFLIIASLSCVLHSCVRPMYPGLQTNPLGPRIIQPVSQRGNTNTLPEDANFVQSYTNYKKNKTNSQFGALVRSIEFEYDISDSISINPRITSGFDEGEMTGWFTIILDQYELTYKNDNPQVREYVEKISYEEQNDVNQNRIMYDPIGAAAQNTREKQTKIVNRSQLYNSAKFYLEPEDAKFIQRSKTLYYIIHLQNCSIAVYPTKEQFRVLKRMILKHYSV